MPVGDAWAGVSVKGVHGVTHRCRYDYVVLAYWDSDAHIRNPQRLSVNGAVRAAREQLGERGSVHQRRSESVFLGVCSIAGEVIVVSEDAREIGNSN